MLRLRRATPESHGIRSEAIGRFIDDVQNKGLELHSFMMQRGGDVVAEAWWKPYVPEIPHELYSLSKSFTSTAVGFAVQDGLLTVDDYVLSFFPSYKSPCDNLKKMKIKHLLSMNTGHTDDTMHDVLWGEKDCVTSFLEIDVAKEPGTHFLYNTGATYMLSVIVQKLVGMNINDYLDEKLYKPLGINYPVWDMSKDGISLGGIGLYLTTEDIMKFSIFLQNKGVWEGKRLLSAEWIDEATTSQSDNSKGGDSSADWCAGYGYQFWMCSHGAYRGDGAFGQLLIVMNEQNATICITGGIGDVKETLNSVWEILLPAMGDKALPENTEANKKLVEKIGRLEYPVEYNDISDTIKSEIDGKTFALDPNRLDIERIKFCFLEDSCVITMHHNNNMKLEFVAGHTNPKYGEMIRPSHVPLLLKAMIRGTWISRDEYKVTARFYETAYTMESVYKFDNDKITMSNKLNVLFKPFTIKGKVV